MREVIETARAVTGREIVAVEEEPPAPAIRRGSWPPTRAPAIGLGWAPEQSLEDMVRDAWAWHQAHPDGY